MAALIRGRSITGDKVSYLATQTSGTKRWFGERFSHFSLEVRALSWWQGQVRLSWHSFELFTRRQRS